MRECPNPECRGIDLRLSRPGELGERIFVYCLDCGVSGPDMPTPSKAIAAWDALPRVGDVPQIKQYTEDDGTPPSGLYLSDHDCGADVVFIGNGQYVFFTNHPNLRDAWKRHTGPAKKIWIALFEEKTYLCCHTKLIGPIPDPQGAGGGEDD